LFHTVISDLGSLKKVFFIGICQLALLLTPSWGTDA